MASARAARPPTPAASTARAPLRPVPAPIPPTPAGPRRTGALGAGGRLAPATGADGDVVVRYDAIYHRAEAAAGERRLLLAVLEDGIRTLLKHAHAEHGRARALRREAVTWIRTDARDDVFAFERICEALGIDAGRLRARILAQASADPGRPGH